MLKLRSWLVTLALTFLIPATAFAYTNADFSGSYAPSVSGPSSVALASEPLTVGTGVMIADGAGNVSGHATLRSHSAACNGTFDSGLYHVDPDGTGYIAVNFDTSDPGCFSIVFDVSIALSGNGERVDIANDENDSMIGTLIQQTKSGFSNSDFSGSYALGVTGPSSLVLASEPRTVDTGVMVSDGAGNVGGHATFRSNGVNCSGNFESGVYNIGPDGTGYIAVNYITGDPGCFSMVFDVSVALSGAGERADIANNVNDYMLGTLTLQLKAAPTPEPTSTPTPLPTAAPTPTFGSGFPPPLPRHPRFPFPWWFFPR
ncbi:MAG: hypothetical protein ACLQU2_30805 [Candidatus Binataceae bacterium]